MSKRIYFLFIVFVGISIFSSCKKKETDVASDVVVQDFVWKGLNLWYFWQDQVPNLSDSRFKNNEEYIDYLKQFSDPIKFFQNELIFKPTGGTEKGDRFSHIVENYKDFVQSLSGIEKSNGLNFGLSRISGGNRLFGIVRYVAPNSNASSKDISRGSIFVGVNGTSLNTGNFRSLLFGSSDTYTLNMATVINGVITPNNKTVTLTKQANFMENPIHMAKTFEVGGKKIGYLMYNQFLSRYDVELNNAFGTFKSNGVTELILDFRYNPGGSVETSRLLSSMVYRADPSKLYLRRRWNAKIQRRIPTDQLERYFADRISINNSGSVPINSLNLDKVYILVTQSTASASELVINSLNPYMGTGVQLIGGKTVGKNEFSITLVDDPSNNYLYSPNREDKINSNNSYAMQPLVGRNENRDGFSDYTDGFTPQTPFRESLSNMGVLGDLKEPFLAKAIEKIMGINTNSKLNKKEPNPLYLETFTSSKMFTPTRDNMYLETPLKLKE